MERQKEHQIEHELKKDIEVWKRIENKKTLSSQLEQLSVVEKNSEIEHELWK